MKKLSYNQAHSICLKLFKKIGANHYTSKSVADGLSYASLRGIDSHGLRLLPHYIKSGLSKRKNLKPNMKINNKFPSLLSIDADHAYGHTAGFKAIEKGSKIAKKFGICAVSVYNSSHPGAMGSIVTKASENNLIGIGFTNADSLVLSHNGVKPFFGTNPLCISFPRKNKKEPFCLDMSTSKITWNKLNMLKRKNRHLPKNYAANSFGLSTIYPNKANSLFPIGDYKGYGLGATVEVFCSILSGMPFGVHLLPMFTSDISKKRFISQFYIILRTDFVISNKQFINSIEKMTLEVNKSKSSKKNKKVLLPNQPEINIMRHRLKNGIPIESSLVKEINNLINENNLSIRNI